MINLFNISHVELHVVRFSMLKFMFTKWCFRTLKSKYVKELNVSMHTLQMAFPKEKITHFKSTYDNCYEKLQYLENHSSRALQDSAWVIFLRITLGKKLSSIIWNVICKGICLEVIFFRTERKWFDLNWILTCQSYSNH